MLSPFNEERILALLNEHTTREIGFPDRCSVPVPVLDGGRSILDFGDK